MEIFMKVRTRCLPLVLLLVLLTLFVGCGENKNVGNDTAVSESNGTTVTDAASVEVSTKEPAAETARIENGRLSAIEPPEGWLQGKSTADNQLIYLFKHDLYDEYPEDAPKLSIDIDEYDTPEKCITGAKELSERWEEECEIGEVTIGSIPFLTFASQSARVTSLFGTKDGVTLSISVAKRLEVNDPDVNAIIGSISVAAD
jgi:hypothetical protein